MRTLICCLMICSIVVIGCTDPVNQQNAEPRVLSPLPAKENRLVGQYIVTLKENGKREVITKVFQQYGIKSIRDLSRSRYLIILEQDPGPEAITKQAATSSDIENVQANYLYRSM